MNKLAWGAISLVFLIPIFMGPARGWIHILRKNEKMNSSEPQKSVIRESKDSFLTKKVRLAQQQDLSDRMPETAEKSSIHDNILNFRLQSKERIENIQRALKNAGFYTGEIDGIAGMRTRRAIKVFQKSKGLQPDGVVGPKTWEELNKVLKN
jgi:murein L,D-transpeptidase YcbB/YkuD